MPPTVVGVLGMGFFGAQTLLDHPVRQLEIEGSFQRVTPIQVEAALEPGLDRGFLSSDLGALQRRVRQPRQAGTQVHPQGSAEHASANSRNTKRIAVGAS